MQGIVASEESASKEMFRNALQLAAHLGLVGEAAEDLREQRADFERELNAIREDIVRLARRTRRPEPSPRDGDDG